MGLVLAAGRGTQWILGGEGDAELPAQLCPGARATPGLGGCPREPGSGGRSVFLGGVGLVSLDSQPTYLPTSPAPEAAAGPDRLTDGPGGRGHVWWVAGKVEAVMESRSRGTGLAGRLESRPAPWSGLCGHQEWPGPAPAGRARREDRLRVLESGEGPGMRRRCVRVTGDAQGHPQLSPSVEALPTPTPQRSPSPDGTQAAGRHGSLER